MNDIVVLGSTGSVGVNTLDVVARHAQRFRVVGLSAGTRAEALLDQCRRFRPPLAVLREEAAAGRLQSALDREGIGTRMLWGEDGLCTLARQGQIVMTAIVGAAALRPTLAAVGAGKRVLLANKEPLVMVGELILREARAAGATLLPIDSEHNAIFQCLPAGGDSRLGVAPAGVRRLLLTGSGGPFRNRALAELAHVTPAQACAHPNWRMGRKISVDSATMMNKGLELIEACRLFNIASDKIQIVVHPQSIIHSMVEYVDGSILAQLGQPDMRTPIAHALGWPERIDAGVKRLNLFDVARLDFEPPDLDRFPCLRLAQQAARAGGTTPAILNAANEVAVAAFLAGTLPFIEIARVIDQVLEALPGTPADTLEQVLDADGQARRTAQRMMGSASGSTAGGGR